MAIKQQIVYNSNTTYFAGFLQSIIDRSSVVGSVAQHDFGLTLLLSEEDAEALERFSIMVQKELPHSLFLGDIATNRVEQEVVASSFKSKSYAIAPCSLCNDAVINPASKHYLDDNYTCRHYANENPHATNPHATFSPHYSEGATLLVVDTAKMSELFYLTEAEQRALLSIEKPTLKVTIKDETLKEMTKKHFIKITLAFDVRSTLAVLNAREAEVLYLFVQMPSRLEVSVLKESCYIVHDAIGVSKSLKALHEQSVLNRFLNISSEAGFQKALGAYISEKGGIEFLIYDSKEPRSLIRFGSFDAEATFEKMRSKNPHARLLEKFEAKYPARMACGNRTLFETVATLLGLETQSYEAFSDKAMEFHGNGGLKVDMNFSESDFDYAAFLGSIMSFTLADVEARYLAYSIYEALGDMLITTLTQLKAKYHIENFVLFGDMLANSVLHSRIESKFALSKPYISKSIALDS